MTKRNFFKYKYMAIKYSNNSIEYVMTNNEKTAMEYAIKHGTFYIKSDVYYPKHPVKPKKG